jgi:S1-C subfamily serine protease
MPGRDDDFLNLAGFSVEGNLARGPEPDPWSVLAPKEDQHPPGPRFPERRMLALLLGLALLAGAVAGAVAGRITRPEASTRSLPAVTPVPFQVGTVSDLIEQTSPSVVLLSSHVASFKEMVGSTGTLAGVLVDDRGYILTSRSGVDKAGELGVVLSDGRQFRGKVERTSPDNDFAIVKIEGAAGLQVARLGRSQDMRSGDPVLSVGKSPDGALTVAQSVVSGLHRKVGDLDGLIETDASVPPTNVGGPLLNLAGEVVGISITPPPNTPGTFAIGIDSMRPFVDQVVERRAPLTSGLKVATLTPVMAFLANLQYRPGVIVIEVANGQPGEQGGIQPGDVITQLNGEPVENEERFIRLTVASLTERVVLTVARGQQPNTSTVPLQLKAVPAPS